MYLRFNLRPVSGESFAKYNTIVTDKSHCIKLGAIDIRQAL